MASQSGCVCYSRNVVLCLLICVCVCVCVCVCACVCATQGEESTCLGSRLTGADPAYVFSCSQLSSPEEGTVPVMLYYCYTCCTTLISASSPALRKVPVMLYYCYTCCTTLISASCPALRKVPVMLYTCYSAVCGQCSVCRKDQLLL